MRRKLVNAGFTRKRVKDKEPSIEQLCDTLIDAVCERGECDFVRDIAAPLPMVVIGDMLGVLPEDREMLLKWSDDLVSGLSSHCRPKLTSRRRWTPSPATRRSRTDMIAKRRAEPTDDLLSVLVHAEVDGERLSDDEIVMESLLILIGGDETTRHSVRRHRAAAAPPRSVGAAGRTIPDLLPGAIEEMLRWTSPVKNMCRTLTADTEFHGTQLQGGREDHAAVRVGQPRRDGVRRPGELSTSTAIRTATWRSASARTSAWATSWPGSSCS